MDKYINCSVADTLAIERTKLANERTFLSYFRTGIVFLSSGIAIIELEFLSDMRYLGVLLLIISPAVILIGVWRFLKMKIRINEHYKSAE